MENEHSREFVSKLASKGVPITYTALSCVPYFMNQVSKVIVGALTMYSNGSLLGLAGTAVVSERSPGGVLREQLPKAPLRAVPRVQVLHEEQD